MKFKEWIEQHSLKNPNFNTYDVILMDSPNTYVETYGRNGYVVIPDDMPIDYYSGFYKFLDDSTVGGLTFGGYILRVDGRIKVMYLDSGNQGIFMPEFDEGDLKAIEEIKSHCQRVIGFDNQHYRPNEMNAADGAHYIAKQLKEYEGKNK